MSAPNQRSIENADNLPSDGINQDKQTSRTIEIVKDLGSTIQDYPNIEVQRVHIELQRLKGEMDWRIYYRRSQIKILLIFVSTFFMLLLFSSFYKYFFNENYSINELLIVILPLFSFVLGMGMTSREGSEK